MPPIGLILAFAGTLCWAISAFPFTTASRIMSVSSMNLLRMLSGTLLVMIVAMCFETNNFFTVFSGKYAQAWLWLGLSGITALGIGDYFMLRMYAILSPRYGSVIGTLSPAAALVAGIVLVNENINIIGIIGIAVTIIGVSSMSLGRTERSAIPDHGHGSILSGIVFGIISAICNGTGLAMSKKAFVMQASEGNSIHPITGSFIRFLVGSIVVVVFMLLSKKLIPNLKNIRSQPLNVLTTALTGVVFGPLLGVSCALTAIQYIDVAVAQTIFALVPVAALLISHFIYKEKITRYALLGVLAAIAGVAVLIWRIKIAALLNS